MPGTPRALTVGTAGHIDHGKTALVRALTGTDTDRLPEERARGITLVLGFAPLRLAAGRMLSLVDVPGHERLIRMMVSGATGIDLFLLVIAADDGVMPQTREHVRIMRALGVDRGVVAITKSDLADAGPAAGCAAALLPGAEVIPCSTRTGVGVAAVAAALDRAAAAAPSRPLAAPATLHIDRVFAIAGAGTIVTGTLWSGVIRRGERLTLVPQDRPVRARGLHVHDRAVEEAAAGQRVAVNLAGVQRRAVARGDVLAGPGAALCTAHQIEAGLVLDEPLRDRERVQVLHGTRAVAGRALALGGDRWQLRLEQPLIAAAGDRLVVRRISPPGTLGGGLVVAAAGRGRRPAQRTGRAPGNATVAGMPQLGPEALALEERLRAAGHEPLAASELGAQSRHLADLRVAGRAIRVGRDLHAHPEAIDRVRGVVEQVIRAEGRITLARLRDELGTSRRYAHAFLEHLDTARVTRRQEDDSRVLRRRDAR